MKNAATALDPTSTDPFPERGEVPRAIARKLVPGVIESIYQAILRSIDFTIGTVTGRRAREIESRSLPRPPWNGFDIVHATLDELMLIYLKAGRNDVTAWDFERIEREVEDLIVHHDHRGVGDDPFSHHDDPPAPDDAEICPRTFAGVDGEWLTFASEWEPHPLAPGRERWSTDDRNRTVHVGMLRHDDGPRSWLVLVHGAEMGRPSIDARLLRARRLHEELGVNIAMPVLPRHGPRGPIDGGLRSSFPSVEMAENIHVLSQGIWDVRRTLSWIRTQEPERIGVYGFSLGAYVASLLAGLEADLDALVVGCPLVDLVYVFAQNTPQLAAGAGRLSALFERAELAHRPISPLHLTPVLPRDRIVIFGASADRIVDPLDQMSRLWEHWDRPEVRWITGGHVSSFMGEQPIVTLMEAMAARGVGRRPPRRFAKA